MGFTTPILFWRTDFCSQPGRGMPRPAWVIKNASRQSYHICLAGTDDGFCLLGFSNQTDSDDGHLYFLFDSLCKRYLIVRPNADFLLWAQSAAGDMNIVAAQLVQCFCQLHGLFQIPPPLDPVGCRDAYANRFVSRESSANLLKNLQQQTHTILQRATVLISALVGEWGQELMQ